MTKQHILDPASTPHLRRCVSGWTNGELVLVGTYHNPERGFIAIIMRKADGARIELPVVLHNDYDHLKSKLLVFV